jgi:hypothetical protein
MGAWFEVCAVVIGTTEALGGGSWPFAGGKSRKIGKKRKSRNRGTVRKV